MSMWSIWLLIAAVFMIIEVLSQMVWTICLALGALVALVALLLGCPLEWQIVSMAVASVVAFVVLVPSVKKWHQKMARKEGKAARTGMSALLGRRAIVTHQITPGGIGRARIDGDNWQVVAPGEPFGIEPGVEVIVTGYDSIILKVELPHL